MGRRFGFTLLIVAILGIGVVVGRSAAPVSVVANVRHAEADVGLDRIVPDVKFENKPCAEVFDWLQEQTRANIAVNWRAIEAEGIDRKAPVTLRLTGLPLRRVIELVCAQLSTGPRIGYHVNRGVIEVNTATQLARTSVVRIYDVRDVVTRATDEMRQFGTDEPTTQPSNICFPPARPENLFEGVMTELTELIQETVSPEDWREAGGAIGSIRFFGGRLIIAGTPEMHAQIDDLLTMIREGNGEVRVP